MNIYLKYTTIVLSFLLFYNAWASDFVSLNEGLPVMVDSKTELHNILLKDMTVIYTYQLKDIEVKEAKKLKNLNKNFIEHNACNDRDIQCLFKKDLDVKFVYKIKDEEILNVKLNKDICLNVTNNSKKCDI